MLNRRTHMPSLVLSLLLFVLAPAYRPAEVVSKDNAPPTVTLAIPAPTGNNGWYNQPVSISVQAFDSGGVKHKMISLGGGTWYKQSLTIRKDGTYLVIGKATDRAGNTATARQLIHVDMTAPTATFITPEQVTDVNEENWMRSSANLSLMGEDAMSGVYKTELTAKNIYQTTERSLLDVQEMYMPVKEQPGRQQVVLGKVLSEKRVDIALVQSGSYVVSGYVEDIAGNRSPVETEIIVDKTAPQISIDQPATYYGDIALSGEALDYGSGISQVWLDHGEGWYKADIGGGSWSSLWETEDLKDGEYILQAKVLDKAGNFSTASLPVTVVNNLWPVFALCGVLLSLGLVAMYDPRRLAVRELSETLARYARMDENARHLRKDF